MTTSSNLKTIADIVAKPSRHWVGDGFPVHGMLGYNDIGRYLNPFIMLDYAAPYDFKPGFKPRGVGFHPHRGFETVTFAYKGEVDHRDSHGGGGTIGTGDVQWMTAGSGIQHEEMHSKKFTKEGGPFEMIQLWVNLRAKDKLTPPSYQALTTKNIPVVKLPDNQGTLRVVAGTYKDATGPAKTHSPMNVYDVCLNKGAVSHFDLPAGWATGIVVRKGSAKINGRKVSDTTLVAFNKDGSEVVIDATEDTELLLFTGEPIDEPIAAYGPFVMNTQNEIMESFQAYQEGKFGGAPM